LSDSLLEGDGFEPSVPRQRPARPFGEDIRRLVAHDAVTALVDLLLDSVFDRRVSDQALQPSRAYRAHPGGRAPLKRPPGIADPTGKLAVNLDTRVITVEDKPAPPDRQGLSGNRCGDLAEKRLSGAGAGRSCLLNCVARVPTRAQP